MFLGQKDADPQKSKLILCRKIMQAVEKVGDEVDGQGVLLGLLIASAQCAEIWLAEPILATTRVPQQGWRPKACPRSW